MKPWMFVGILVACGGGGGTAARGPIDVARKPAGQGWTCAVQTNGPGGGCFRDPQACADVAAASTGDDMELSPCTPQPTAWCHTHFYKVTNEPGYFCRPTEAMCEKFAADWATPPTDYANVSRCAEWD